MRLVCSHEAIADLVRLRALIADKDPAAAARAVAELVARLESLHHFPHMGIEVAQAPQPAQVRDVVSGNYVVRYSIHAESLAILHIWHHYESRA